MDGVARRDERVAIVHTSSSAVEPLVPRLLYTLLSVFLKEMCLKSWHGGGELPRALDQISEMGDQQLT